MEGRFQCPRTWPIHPDSSLNSHHPLLEALRLLHQRSCLCIHNRSHSHRLRRRCNSLLSDSHAHMYRMPNIPGTRITPSTHPQSQSAPPPPVSQTHALSEQNGLKQPYGYRETSSKVAILEPSQKRIRRCCKCGSQDCRGKGGRTSCMNVYLGHGKIYCKG